jgi:integration host factor subunit alpha
MTLTKAQIAEAISKEVGFTRTQSLQLVDSLFEIIKQTLEQSEDVLISNFGKFSVHQKMERRGRNPHTGEALMLAPRKVVTFKWSGKLRDRLNKKT